MLWNYIEKNAYGGHISETTSGSLEEEKRRNDIIELGTQELFRNVL